MRDPLAPFIEGFDCSGIVNPYSFQCAPFYTEGDNGGTLRDGTTVHDILAAKARLSWTLNALSSEQYAALTSALNSGESPDTVSAYVFDPTCDAVRLAKFHVTRPDFQFALNIDGPVTFAGCELALEEAFPIARFDVTPPDKTTYMIWERLNLTGLTVTRYDNDGNFTDITEECTVDPADGAELAVPGNFVLTVSFPCGAYDYALPVAVEQRPVIASGDWWALYENYVLYIYRNGDMPDYDYGMTPWYSYRDKIRVLKIRDSVTTIGNYAFADCFFLTSATIPDSVTTIGYYAFASCDALTNVTIPDSVTTIGESAFAHCRALTRVTIPNSVTTINDSTFYDSGHLRNVTIPDSVTTIGHYAFAHCHALTRVEIPDSVMTIGYYAFDDCSALTRVTIPDSVTTIGESAFAHCYALTNVTIGDSVTKISAGAFSLCSALKNVTIPDSVTTIDYEAFYDCDALTDVYYAGTESQWNAIRINIRNDALINATIHYNSAGPS